MAIKIDYNRLFYEPEALDMKNYPKVDDNWSIDFYDILADQEKKRYQELANNKMEEDEVERNAIKDEFSLLSPEATAGDVLDALKRASKSAAAQGGGSDLLWKLISREDQEAYRDALSESRLTGQSKIYSNSNGIFEVSPDRKVTKIYDYPDKKTGKGKEVIGYKVDALGNIIETRFVGSEREAAEQGLITKNNILYKQLQDKIAMGDVAPAAPKRGWIMKGWDALFGGGSPTTEQVKEQTNKQAMPQETERVIRVQSKSKKSVK